MSKATEKQVRYVKYLMAQAGIDNKYLGAWAKEFGLTMRERQGRIDDISFNVARKLIDALTVIADRRPT